MWFSAWRTRRRWQKATALDHPSGLTNDELTELATYNSERARGLAHTFDKDRRMKILQDRFDQPYKEIAARRQKEHEERVAHYANRSSRVARDSDTEG